MGKRAIIKTWEQIPSVLLDDSAGATFIPVYSFEFT